jgi:tetratricopeptide (TPR) repeat protein
MRIPFTAAVTLLFCLQANACLNYYGETLYGKRVTSEIHGGGHYLHDHNNVNREAVLADARKLRGIIAANPSNLNAKNDLAVDLIKLGQYAEAKELLLILLPARKEEYIVNANLGVLYELMGDLDSALHFTSTAYRINPGSHKGSEWLHLKILEVTKGNTNELLKNYKLLDLNFGDGVVPDTTAIAYRRNLRNMRIDAEVDEIGKLVSDIEYQLHERMYFVKSDNKIVGELLFALGDMYSLFFDQYWALWAYTKAMQYGTQHDEVVKKRGLYLLPRVKMKGKPGKMQYSSTIQDYNKVIAFWENVKKTK